MNIPYSGLKFMNMSISQKHLTAFTSMEMLGDQPNIQATLLNPDMYNPDFCLNWTDWKVPVPSNTYNSYTHNLDFA